MKGSIPPMRHSYEGIWSWIVSFVIHGLAIGTAAPLLLDVTVPPRQDAFRWDVTVREASPPEPLASDTPVSSPSAESAATMELSPQELAALQAFVPPLPDEIDTEVVERREHPEDPESAATDLTGELPAFRHEAGAKTSSKPSTPARSSSANLTTGRSGNATPLGAAGPAAVPPPTVDPIVPSSSVQDQVEEQVRRVVQRPAAVGRDLLERSTKSDYGWLARDLWDRVERKKRYPYPARMNRWEGTVVLEAVIRDDGELAQITVLQSSGRAILDDDAVETLRRCAPVKLTHALDRREVTLHIPIMYRLD